MNYNDIEKLEEQLNTTEHVPSALNNIIFQEYLAKEQKRKTAKENPFVFFYEDVISNSLKYNYRSALGETVYKNAGEDANCCLEVCTDFSRINGYAVGGWLVNALKFADHIVLHYIQEVCKETPQKYPQAGDEKSRYIQISYKEGEISTCGAVLKDLYEMRNRLEHRTVFKDGKQELVPPKRNKIRRDIVRLYPLAMGKMLEEYKQKVPSHIITE